MLGVIHLKDIVKGGMRQRFDGHIVEIGGQLLMTCGALTTFSIANNVAKYFVITPAMFILVGPGGSRMTSMP
jgi:high-affinity K+ transport system ATPase subunit B